VICRPCETLRVLFVSCFRNLWIPSGDSIRFTFPCSSASTRRSLFSSLCAQKIERPSLLMILHNQLLRDAWQTQPSWLVGRYMIMPNHVHLFCRPGEFPSMPLIRWVKFWKSHTARHWFRPKDAPVWQRHFWDTQLRRRESYDAKWEYVMQNPVRAGLVDRADNWPYQDELNLLDW
jgi:putative transposase